jgi:integrase
MPRLTQSVPKYRKHRPSGQAVVEIAGKRHYLGPHGTRTSKIQYDALVAEWLASGRSPTFGTPQQQLTVVELLVDYLRFAKSYYGTGPNSETRHIARVGRTLRKLYGRTVAAEFDPVKFKAVRQRLVDEGLARKYVNSLMQRITRMFKWAGGEGRISASTYQSLALVAGLKRGKSAAPETDPIRPVIDDVIDATLPHLPEVVADMVRLNRLTAMRPAELLRMRPRDIDRSNEIWAYTPSTHKTSYRERNRVVFLGFRAQEILARYLVRDSEVYCFQPIESEAKRRAAAHEKRKTPMSCGNVLGSNRVRHKRRHPAGKAYSVASYRRAVARACRKAFPIPAETAADAAAVKAWEQKYYWSPARLRHTAATAIRRQFGLEGSQVVLGHSDANVTEIYAERDQALAIRVARQTG